VVQRAGVGTTAGLLQDHGRRDLGRERRVAAVAAWRNVGLEDIRDHGRITLDSSGRREARFITGRLGSFAVKSFSPL